MIAESLEGYNRFFALFFSTLKIIVIVLYNIVLNSHIILFFFFLFLALRLIKASQAFEFKVPHMRFSLRKVDNKVNYGSLIYGILSVGSLFKVFHAILSLCGLILPLSSPFLNLIGYEYLYHSDNIKKDFKSFSTTEQLILIGTIFISLISLMSLIWFIYLIVFNKILHIEHLFTNCLWAIICSASILIFGMAFFL